MPEVVSRALFFFPLIIHALLRVNPHIRRGVDALGPDRPFECCENPRTFEQWCL